MAKISSEAANGMKQRIDQVTADEGGIPGVVYCAVNKNGDVIFEHASGKKGFGLSDPMDMDTVFWIASCTKMITGIACMQLVEQGKLALDDVELVEKLAPVRSGSYDFFLPTLNISLQELKAVKVLQDGKLVDKQRGITLRMLLAHTGKRWIESRTKLH